MLPTVSRHAQRASVEGTQPAAEDDPEQSGHDLVDGEGIVIANGRVEDKPGNDADECSYERADNHTTQDWPHWTQSVIHAAIRSARTRRGASYATSYRNRTDLGVC